MNSVSDKSCKQNQNTNLCSVSFFLNIVSFKGYVENMVHLDGPLMITQYSTEEMQEHTHTRTHTHTHRVHDTYCSSMATLVTQMCLSATLYTHYLSCLTDCQICHT
jgi:hypothetical protein